MLFFAPGFASPYVLITGGDGGAAKAGNIGSEAVETKAIKWCSGRNRLWLVEIHQHMTYR